MDHTEIDLAYLENRVRKESNAAARAGSAAATLVPVVLETRCVKRSTDCPGESAAAAGQAWVEENRLW